MVIGILLEVQDPHHRRAKIAIRLAWFICDTIIDARGIQSSLPQSSGQSRAWRSYGAGNLNDDEPVPKNVRR